MHLKDLLVPADQLILPTVVMDSIQETRRPAVEQQWNCIRGRRVVLELSVEVTEVLIV
jgi:hypothetical protein